MFKILKAYEKDDRVFLAQMHNLRYRIFFQNLKWINGLQVFSQMEFDQYDHGEASYLVHINKEKVVDACARLTPTSGPNLLCHSFNKYIKEIEIPASDKVYEISRLCADMKTAPRTITGQLMAAMLEFGLMNGIESYVSLSDIKIIPIVKRFGWSAEKLGPCGDTGTETSVALGYDVNEMFLENVKKIVGIKHGQGLLDSPEFRATARHTCMVQQISEGLSFNRYVI